MSDEKVVHEWMDADAPEGKWIIKQLGGYIPKLYGGDDIERGFGAPWIHGPLTEELARLAKRNKALEAENFYLWEVAKQAKNVLEDLILPNATWEEVMQPLAEALESLAAIKLWKDGGG